MDSVILTRLCRSPSGEALPLRQAPQTLSRLRRRSPRSIDQPGINKEPSASTLAKIGGRAAKHRQAVTARQSLAAGRAAQPR
ncbi:MAG TPA: hypothetical protein VHL50_08490 [Pyrinomonadaceae bacterium]|nr:hypothetical protein [Pyrinomonadaceae bacterium]